MMLSRISLCVAALGFLVLTGCGEKGPALGTVSGNIMLEGEPVEGAFVNFSPLAGGNEILAANKTDADGFYELQFSEERMGCMPGKYQVQISTQDWDKQPDGSNKVIKERIPKHYIGIDSILEFDVAEGENDGSFDLAKKKPK